MRNEYKYICSETFAGTYLCSDRLLVFRSLLGFVSPQRNTITISIVTYGSTLLLIYVLECWLRLVITIIQLENCFNVNLMGRSFFPTKTTQTENCVYSDFSYTFNFSLSHSQHQHHTFTYIYTWTNCHSFTDSAG